MTIFLYHLTAAFATLSPALMIYTPAVGTAVRTTGPVARIML